MTDRAIQIAVARADLILGQVAAWPWKRMILSLLIAAVVIHVVKSNIKQG